MRSFLLVLLTSCKEERGGGAGVCGGSSRQRELSLGYLIRGAYVALDISIWADIDTIIHGNGTDDVNRAPGHESRKKKKGGGEEKD